MFPFGISNFVEEISSLSHSIVFLYFIALFMLLSYLSWLFSGTLYSVGYIFPFLLCLCFSSFLRYLYSLIRQPLCFLAFLFFLAGIDWGQEERRAIDDKWTWVWANSGRYRRTGKTGNAATHGVAKGQTRLSGWTNFVNFCNFVVTKKRLREISFFLH